MSSIYTTSSDDEVMSPTSISTIPCSPDSSCKVEILEQPMKKIRFRYLSELQGTPHGPLLGERSTKANKTFPKVKLVGYDANETIKIKCWLVDKSPKNLGGGIKPHCHDLVVRRNSPKNEIVVEPHEIAVSRQNNYTAVFENMVVLHCVQKQSESKYFEKESKWRQRLMDGSESTKFDKKRIRDIIKSINKNEVYLYFEAYVEHKTSITVLGTALSNPIRNLKNPISGDLKICKSVNSCGSADGNTEVALFTEKIPIDVKVKFSNDSNDWSVLLTPESTHRNVALTVRSPPYPFAIDDGSVKVNFCLYRESDGGESNAMEFTYLPSEVQPLGKRKRSDSPETDLIECDLPAPMLEIFGEGRGTMMESFDGFDNIDFDDFLNDRNNDDNVSTDFSGSSLLATLGEPRNTDIEVVSTSKFSLEYDGPTDGSMIHLSKNNETRKKFEAGANENINIKIILKDILYTLKYANHMNCLRKCVEKNDPVSLNKLLSAIKHFSLSANLPALEIIKTLKNERKETLLHTAVMYGYINVVEILMKFNFNPFLYNVEGSNCFHLASKLPHSSVLKTLVKYSDKTDKLSVTDANGLNILHISVRSNHIETVRFIIESRLIDINSKDMNSGDAPLHLACRLQLYQIAEYLIQNGADVNACNLAGFTPLQLSVDINDHFLASLLISKSDPHQECKSLALGAIDADYEEEKLSALDSVSENIEHHHPNSFSLAQDLLMLDILSGKMSMLGLEHKYVENSVSPSNESTMEKPSSSELFTPDQIEKLCHLLHKDDRWKAVVEHLNLKHFLPLMTSVSFKEPTRVLLNIINSKDNGMLGSDNEDKKLNLVKVFKTMGLEEAALVIS